MIDEKLIKDIVWWIPFKKIRNTVRRLLLTMNYLKNKTEHIENIEHQLYILNRNINKNIVYVSFSNWWENDIKNLEKSVFFRLFEQILKKHDKVAVYNSYNPDIEIFSVLGPIENIKKSGAKAKIFYTLENIHYVYSKKDNKSNYQFLEQCAQYSDNCLDLTDLSIGFDYLNNNKYIRLPFWMLCYFNILLDGQNLIDNINNKINIINTTKTNKTKFCSLMARYDWNYIKSAMYKKISKIDKINCPSQLFHNDNDLKNIFNDNKTEYLKQFKFNICPENSKEKGYITEKLFDAFCAGCIPIWWGDENIEPDVINKNAVLYWKKDEDNEVLIKEIEKLNKDEKLYESFMSQPKLHDKASDYIYGQITSLHEKIEDIIKTKIL